MCIHSVYIQPIKEQSVTRDSYSSENERKRKTFLKLELRAYLLQSRERLFGKKEKKRTRPQKRNLAVLRYFSSILKKIYKKIKKIYVSANI